MKRAFLIKLVVNTPDTIGVTTAISDWLPAKLKERGIEIAEVVGSREVEFIGELKDY